ncbi:NAD(P)H-dependent oxidoreductase [Sphingomonas sp. 37zxx]|uniref:NAD(P)H-dependent oxidoreductase n=1 Tax=Sphingomonas sp. 37zxx TaxID=1550073 RepID=UPI00053BE443|nr:NAD(P)H-dependent oxidoreductase [Sphingomonas sp. 37zxx]
MAMIDDGGTDKTIRHIVVLGHPSPGSFNHSVARTYCETVRECGQVAQLRDLYALEFDPLLRSQEQPDGAHFAPAPDVQPELGYLQHSAIVTLIYPIWFGMPPAIIKGYVDRVMGAGFAARNLKTAGAGPSLHGKKLMQFSSSASTKCWLEEQGQWVALRRAFDGYLTTVFGMEAGEHVHFDSIVEEMKPRHIDEALAVVREKTRSVCAALLQRQHQARVQRLLG